MGGRYTYDVNTHAKLGHGGVIPVVLGQLMKDMWAAQGPRSIAPRRFKQVAGKFCEQFEGYEQQDAQELLAFAIGALSEDLNRVKDKPYTDLPDSGSRPDDRSTLA